RCHGLRVNLRPPDAHPVSARATWPDRSAGGNTSEKADSGWLRNQHVPDKAPPDSPYMAMAGKTGSTIGRCPTRRIRMIRGYRVSGRTPIYS
ncbi:hypothetical protein, partial [Duncaniella muris]|uniref:hypothetical protein n=1 Tax=Duncaniella muris TaxID=2094150 RepID=UPI0025B6A7DA